MRRAAVLLVILLQIGLLGYMVVGRELIVKTGDVVHLRTAPVDPRDLFRGDYVRLEYNISVIPRNKMRGGLADHMEEEGYPVYAVLKDGPGGIAALDYAADRPPEDGPFIKGRIARDWRLGRDGRAIRVKYGIETYYVEQGRGLVIEVRRGRRGDVQIPLLMAVALGKNGEGVITGHRWSRLGIGIEVLSRTRDGETTGDDRTGPGSPKIRVTLRNAHDEPAALVMLPRDRSFSLRPVAGSETDRRTIRSTIPPPPPADSDVTVLEPEAERVYEIDLSRKPWHLAADEGTVPIGALPPAARFRLVYAPPDAAACRGLDNAGLIWHGELPSQAFNGAGRVD
mgnify:CR=1 FL=1